MSKDCLISLGSWRKHVWFQNSFYFDIIEGRMAEWSKALILGTSHYGGAGSNPAPPIKITIVQDQIECHKPTIINSIQ